MSHTLISHNAQIERSSTADHADVRGDTSQPGRAGSPFLGIVWGCALSAPLWLGIVLLAHAVI